MTDYLVKAYMASCTRKNDDDKYGYIAYNYGRDGYDICLDSSGKRIELQEGDSFKVFLNGEWVGTRLLYSGEKQHWYLCDVFEDDIAFEEMRVRGYVGLNSAEFEAEKRDIIKNYHKNMRGQGKMQKRR